MRGTTRLGQKRADSRMLSGRLRCRRERETEAGGLALKVLEFVLVELKIVGLGIGCTKGCFVAAHVIDNDGKLVSSGDDGLLWTDAGFHPTVRGVCEDDLGKLGKAAHQDTQAVVSRKCCGELIV